MLKELKIIRDNNKDLAIIFSFLERVAGKLVKASVDYKTETTITFIDYNDNAEYFVPFDKVNRILDYCYNEYFFKIIMSGSDFYQKVRKVCVEDLDIEPFLFDIFFRALFVALKDNFEREEKLNYELIKIQFYKIILNTPSDTLDGIPKIDLDYFSKKSKIILKHLEGLKYIDYNRKDLINDLRFQSYFAISCDTFRFYISDSYGFESFSSIFEILDLKSYLNAQSILNHNLLKKLDKIVHMVILASIDDKEAKYFNNLYSDNSNIKEYNKNKEKIRQKNNTSLTLY